MQRLLDALDESDNHASISITSTTNHIRLLLNRHDSGQYLFNVITFWLCNWDALLNHQSIFRYNGNEYIAFKMPICPITKLKTNYLIELLHKLSNSSSVTLNKSHKVFLYTLTKGFLEQKRTLLIHK